MQTLRFTVLLIILFTAWSPVHAGECRAPAVKGRIVYSTTMIFTDNTTAEKGEPLPYVPIRIRMDVWQRAPAYGDGGPRWQLLQDWRYYTFTDANGYFEIPALSENYTNTPLPGTQLEFPQPEFAILEKTANVTIEQDHDSIKPYRVTHPSDSLEKMLEELIQTKAAPVHKKDKDRLNQAIKQIKHSANK